MLVNDLFHFGGFGQATFGFVCSARNFFAMAASSFAASTNRPAMKTDSATLPSLLVVVWNDWPGVSEKQFRFRQSFQSARPISGNPCGPSRSSV